MRPACRASKFGRCPEAPVPTGEQYLRRKFNRLELVTWTACSHGYHPADVSPVSSDAGPDSKPPGTLLGRDIRQERQLPAQTDH